MTKSKFILPAESVERVKAAVASIQTKYGITAAATGKDFKRICAGEEIEIESMPLICVGFALQCQNQPDLPDCKIIMLSEKRRGLLTTKFFFLGAFVIPSMYDLNKYFAEEVPKIELDTKHAESKLFAALLLKRGEK
jgi:hypothetical protein